MTRKTTPAQRQRFYERPRSGETYQDIGASEGVSQWTVRHWCRRQRDGGECQTVYRREPAELLSHFDPKVRYCILRFRLQHPRWGPNRILAWLKKRPSLRGLPLPSEASIGRYLHQWVQFRRRPKEKVVRERPNTPEIVHQRWQIDFKMGIAWRDNSLVNLHTVRDPAAWLQYQTEALEAWRKNFYEPRRHPHPRLRPGRPHPRLRQHHPGLQAPLVQSTAAGRPCRPLACL